MQPTLKQAATSEVAETKRKASGKARVKASHVSPLLREVILDRFQQRPDTEDIAEEMRIPVRTVTDVLLAAVLRKGPQPERGGSVLTMRRSA
jgi:hypothetical protein